MVHGRLGLLLLALFLLGCSEAALDEGPAPGDAPTTSDDPNLVESADEHVSPGDTAPGYTKFRRSKDTRVFFVSSQGDDDNDGLTVDTPLRTADAALDLVRDGAPDWILFRRGDRFEGLGQLQKSGRSANEPLLFGSYGNARDRPWFESGFRTNGANSAPESTDYLVVVGLRFEPPDADPNSDGFDPEAADKLVSWLRGTRGLWIEDCVFRFGELSFQDFDGVPARNVVLFRSQVLDAYGVDGNTSGVYAEGTINLVIRESLIDHNGWNEEVSGAEATKFNHDLYFQNGTRGSEIRDSIVMRASSHGIMFRGGGEIQGNFLFRNPINILLGGGTNPDPGGVNGRVVDNVLAEAVDMATGSSRGWGIGLENIADATVQDNLLLNCEGSQCQAIDEGVDGVAYAENQVLGWTEQDSVPVTLEGYAQELGYDDVDEFLAALRSQSRFSYRPELTATAINAYFRSRVAED